jgi:hypothetical protein
VKAIQGGINPTNVSIVRDRFMNTTWGQSGQVRDATGYSDYSYNRYTPNHYVAGCVAVAMAQVMKWFQYPPAARGSHTIEIDDDGAGEWSYDDQFEYDQMPDRLADGCTAYQIDLVAKLVRDAGIAVGMNYTSDGSSAADGDVPDHMIRFFGYSSATYQSTYWTDHRTEMQSDLLSSAKWTP